MSKRIIIVGANAAGIDAAIAARKTNTEAEITLVTGERVGTYSRCGLPFVLSGLIRSFEDLIVYPSSLHRVMRFDLRLETRAVHIDTEAKTVEVETKDGRREELGYDDLVLATGGHPTRPRIEGLDKEGVFTLRTLEDGERIAEAMRGARSAVVIGSGYVGLETAEAFVKRGLKTTVIDLLPSILPRLLDPDMALEVQRRFEGQGINFILGSPAEAVLGEGEARAVSVGGEEVPADLVIVAAGVGPEVHLAREAGIDIGETGGIKTNKRMRTSAEGVYAAGDCAETIHLVTHRPVLPLSGATAVRQGKVAGINAAGGYSIFPGALLSVVSQMFDFEVGSTGLTEAQASRSGLDVAVGKVRGHTRAPYYPGARPIKVKLLVERETRRIVGGQIVGGEEVTQRINALSLAIQKQMTADELVKADTCYAPSVCEASEPMVLAAETAVRKLAS
ncbi:MAG: FAD-dependent oxidoreductase [Candidatus Bathyarchaeia archaeon]